MAKVSTEPVHETTAVDDDGETHSQQPSAPFFQDDLIIEILVRVPARSLLQLKCVCKTWNILISDPQFANHHIRISSMTHQQRLVTCGVSKRWKLLCWPLKSQFEKQPSTHKVKPFTLSLCNDGSYRILGSCNGLICLLTPNEDENMGSGYALLWNPLTRLRSKISPNVVKGLPTYHGFGYDSVNDKYKVLVGVLTFSANACLEIVTKVYTFGEKENCWRTIQNCPYNNYSTFLSKKSPCLSGKFVSNTINFVEKSDDDVSSNNNWVIISFDLEKETYSQILLPKNQDDGQPENTCVPFLDVLKNRLCVCFSSYETGGVVWLMKEYGVFESWTKLMVVKPHQKLTYSMPFCISQNGVLVERNFSFSEALLYEPNTNMFCLPRILSRLGWDYNIYLESLVSPPALAECSEP